MQLSKLNFNFVIKSLFVIVLFELVVGGSGHFTELGPLTLRMFLFFIAVSISFIYLLYHQRIKKDVIIIIGSFTLLSILSPTIGYFNDAPISFILEDFKPLSFFYILLFFSASLTSGDDIKTISNIFKNGALFIGIAYMIIIALLFLKKIDFLTFYAQQMQIGEIFFRTDLFFFFKGFLYLCIGFFFFLFSKSKRRLLALLFLFTCVMLTLTRGFMLFTTLILLYYIAFINQNKLVKTVVLIIGFSAIVIALPLLYETFGNRADSDATRFAQIDQVIRAISPVSFFFGHGLGVGVPIRPIHMELSFLEIFHKQGILGIAFWFGIFIHIFIMFFNIKNKMNKQNAYPYLFGVVFVILQSGTNPFMNNPIGLTMILITIVVFSKYVELEKKSVV